MNELAFTINPALDRSRLSAQFGTQRRVQIRDVLTKPSAERLRSVLERETSWGFAYKGRGEPKRMTKAQVEMLSPDDRRQIANDIHQTAADGAYAVRFNQYPILDAYLDKWHPGSVHDQIIEQINNRPFLDLVRAVSGFSDLIKADAQATLFTSGDFLSVHTDSHVEEGWRVAYVLNLTSDGWSPDWGGYLNFMKEDGDIDEGWKPRFNTLNLFEVPQVHSVSYVPPFARLGRLAITGWFRNR